MRTGVGTITLYDVHESIDTLPAGIGDAKVGGSGDLVVLPNHTTANTEETGSVCILGTKLLHPDGSEKVGISGHVKTDFGVVSSGRFFVIWSDVKAHDSEHCPMHI